MYPYNAFKHWIYNIYVLRNVIFEKSSKVCFLLKTYLTNFRTEKSALTSGATTHFTVLRCTLRCYDALYGATMHFAVLRHPLRCHDVTAAATAKLNNQANTRKQFDERQGIMD